MKAVYPRRNHPCLTKGSEFRGQAKPIILLIRIMTIDPFSTLFTIKLPKQKSQWSDCKCSQVFGVIHCGAGHKEFLHSISSEGRRYGGVDRWCSVKDQVLPILYECCSSAILSKASPSTADAPTLQVDATLLALSAQHVYSHFLVIPHPSFLLPLPLRSDKFSSSVVK